MLGVVEDIHLCIHCLCCNKEGILRHIPRPIYLSLMVYLLRDLQASAHLDHAVSMTPGHDATVHGGASRAPQHRRLLRLMNHDC